MGKSLDFPPPNNAQISNGNIEMCFVTTGICKLNPQWDVSIHSPEQLKLKKIDNGEAMKQVEFLHDWFNGGMHY